MTAVRRGGVRHSWFKAGCYAAFVPNESRRDIGRRSWRGFLYALLAVALELKSLPGDVRAWFEIANMVTVAPEMVILLAQLGLLVAAIYAVSPGVEWLSRWVIRVTKERRALEIENRRRIDLFGRTLPPLWRTHESTLRRLLNNGPTEMSSDNETEELEELGAIRRLSDRRVPHGYVGGFEVRAVFELTELARPIVERLAN